MKIFLKSNYKAFSLIELSIVILIIGILVTGIVQSSRLVNQMKLQTARNLTRNSPINSIKDPLTWIETTSESSFDSELNDGDQVSQINDISIKTSTKYNFSQSNPVKRPLFKKSNLNGLPSLSFDGVDDELLSINILTQVISPFSKNTIFLVMRYYTGVVLLKYENGSGSPRIGIEVNNNFLRFDYPNSTNMLIGSTTNITNKMILITADGNKINQTIYINGAQEATRANSTDIGNAGYNAPISLSGNNGNLFVKSDFAELLIFDRSLTTEERKSIESYLGAKWGIKVS